MAATTKNIEHEKLQKMLQSPKPLPFTHITGKKIDQNSSFFNTVSQARYEGVVPADTMKNTMGNFGQRNNSHAV
jgi:hypothetical protein